MCARWSSPSCSRGAPPRRSRAPRRRRGRVRGGPLAAGPVTVIALGDSLTAGDGDDAGKGFVGRLTEAIAARPGREGSTLTNLGQSGWDSTMMVSGLDGGAAGGAAAGGRRGPRRRPRRGAGDGADRLERPLVRLPERRGRPDAARRGGRDGRRPTARTWSARSGSCRRPGPSWWWACPTTSPRAPSPPTWDGSTSSCPPSPPRRWGRCRRWPGCWAAPRRRSRPRTASRTVDTNDPFWADPARMADDGIHPNAAGYTALAGLWMDGVAPLLGA